MAWCLIGASKICNKHDAVALATSGLRDAPYIHLLILHASYSQALSLLWLVTACAKGPS